jgi:hypothetical protein
MESLLDFFLSLFSPLLQNSPHQLPNELQPLKAFFLFIIKGELKLAEDV